MKKLFFHVRTFYSPLSSFHFLTYNLQPTTYNLQRATYNLQPTTFANLQLITSLKAKRSNI
ncbi:hypothetical protein DHB64_06835 [Antarcticibacterium sp. W02-3]|nr:hypothetical protein [Antarcticibacterium sp. W02-3]